MTGPEHYREAEQLLDWAKNRDTVTERQREHWAALAQVHATLALAASYAEVNPTSMWHEVAGSTAQVGGQQ